MQTRKYPRTMQEAFGPYTSRDLHEKPQRVEPARLALGAAYVLAVVVLSLILAGVIA
jgi:hypothetical protein